MKALAAVAGCVAAACVLGGLARLDTRERETTEQVHLALTPPAAINLHQAGYWLPALGFLARHSCPKDPAPLVVEKARSFFRSRADLDSSTTLAVVLVPLVLLLLIEREVLALAGRREERSFLVFALSVLVLLVIVMLVRLRAYAG